MEPNNQYPWIVIDELENLRGIISVLEYIQEALHLDILNVHGYIIFQISLAVIRHAYECGVSEAGWLLAVHVDFVGVTRCISDLQIRIL